MRRTPRTDAEQQVAELLRTAKRALGLSVSFLSRLDGQDQHLEVVETAIPFLFQEGYTAPQETTLCQAILEGRLPAVIPDLKKNAYAMTLPAARFPRLRSYVSVPVRLSDGSLYGTFCAAGLTSDKNLGTRDRALMEVLAGAAAVIIEPQVTAQARQADVESRVLPVLAAGGPTVVLQPIVDLRSGRRTGAEALSRFPREWGLTPDVVFAEAHEIGRGHDLELAALDRAVDHLTAVGGYVAMNISPETLLTPAAGVLLGRLPAQRVLLELSEHEPVEDYDALHAALEPHRGRGMRLAIDDVGAGFSSLRHIVVTRPDVIKLDRSIVAGIAEDDVLQTLVAALVQFAHKSRATVVAEGVETAEDVVVLRGLDVDLGQGWYFGRPGAPELLREEVEVPAGAGAPGMLPQPHLPADDLAARVDDLRR